MVCANRGPESEAARAVTEVAARLVMVAVWKLANGAYRAVLKLPTLESTVLANTVLLSDAVCARRVPLKEADCAKMEPVSEAL